MTIYEFIKQKYLIFLKAKLEILKKTKADKDLRQIKDEIWEIEDNNNFKVKGCQECLKDVIKEKEFEGNSITFNNTYIYNILNNYISKIDANLDYFNDTQNSEQRYNYEYDKRYGKKR